MKNLIVAYAIFPKNTPYFNAQSLEANNKIDGLRSTFFDTNVHLIRVSDIWFTNATDSNIVSLNGYTIFQNDRKSRGGGVCIYVHNTIHVIKPVLKSESKQID